ncbi:hypothetical protein E2320_005726 [Naja naja]|nr:hypothetical protein E2320_005726 [Naja naja]
MESSRRPRAPPTGTPRPPPPPLRPAQLRPARRWWTSCCSWRTTRPRSRTP